MSGSDRSKRDQIGLAVALLIAVVLGGKLWFYASSQERQYQVEAKAKAGDYSNAARKDAESRCVNAAPADKNSCIEDGAKSGRPNQRDEYDLEAQRIMAAWTRAMGIAAIIGMSVGILGVGLIYTTFRETKRGADEAFRNVEAFIEAERAILHVVGGSVGESNVTPNSEVVYIEVINRGRAAARVVSMGSFKSGRDVPPQPAPRWTVVGAGRTVKILLFDAPDRNTVLSVDCWIDYRSLGKELHRSHFNVNVSWWVPPKDGTIISYSQWFVQTSNENGHPSDN